LPQKIWACPRSENTLARSVKHSLAADRPQPESRISSLLFLSFLAFEQSGIPERRTLSHPFLRFTQASCASADEVQASFAMALDELGLFENAEML
jgi:hypothetical protein